MTHGFSNRDWLEFIEGCPPPDRERTMRQHLAACFECRQKVEQFRSIDRELREVGARIRDSVTICDQRIQNAYRALRFLPDSEPKNNPVEQRLMWLEVFVAGICGTRTAERALRAAAQHANAASTQAITDRQWPDFVRKLSSIVGALCGEPAARLLYAIGWTAA